MIELIIQLLDNQIIEATVNISGHHNVIVLIKPLASSWKEIELTGTRADRGSSWKGLELTGTHFHGRHEVRNLVKGAHFHGGHGRQSALKSKGTECISCGVDAKQYFCVLF